MQAPWSAAIRCCQPFSLCSRKGWFCCMSPYPTAGAPVTLQGPHFGCAYLVPGQHCTAIWLGHQQKHPLFSERKLNLEEAICLAQVPKGLSHHVSHQTEWTSGPCLPARLCSLGQITPFSVLSPVPPQASLIRHPSYQLQADHPGNTNGHKCLGPVYFCQGQNTHGPCLEKLTARRETEHLTKQQ